MGSSISKLFLLLLLAIAPSSGAQAPATRTPPVNPESASPPADQMVAGQVVRPGATRMLPVPHIRVMLHRVGSDSAAPLDSTRADADGRYAFRYRRTGDESAIYFVSALYGGIAYFTPPLNLPVVTGESAEIAVYDTTSAPIRIGVRGHHIVVSAVDANAHRSVTEVYELANDTSVTRIASGVAGQGPVWSKGTPAHASGFHVTQGDIPAAAVAFKDGQVRVFAPIAPGLAQLAFAYDLPASAFPLSVPIEDSTQILEVLVEDEKGRVSGARLRERDPVVLESRSFRRFLADDVPMNAVTLIDLPAAPRASLDRRYLIVVTIVIALAMSLALARALSRR